MEKVIPVTIRERIAQAPDGYLYICGNSDFEIAFDFDEEWKDYDAKTARFSYNETYQDVVFSGNVCPVPIISDTHSFRVGVYAGNLRTTTPAYVQSRKSILCDGGTPADPPPDVYTQMMDLIKLGVSDEQVAAAVEQYLTENPIDAGVQFETDDTLILHDGILSVNTADAPEEDNTLPITSAAVHTTVGNIEILLKTI